jgi:hypothetical protein
MDHKEKEGAATKKCPYCQKEVDALATRCPHCQSKLRGKHDTLYLLLAALGIIIGIFVVLSVISANKSPSPSTKATADSTPPPSVCPTDMSSLKAEARAIDYKLLSKSPDAYKRAPAKYTGQIVEIKEEGGGQGYMRLAVEKTAYGWDPNSIILVGYRDSTDALQGDVVTVYGYLAGTYSYSSQANYQITVPTLISCSIEKEKAAASEKKAAAQITARPTTPKPTAQATWHTVGTFAGSKDTKTAPFAMSGAQWRMTYSCSSIDGKSESGKLFGSIRSTLGLAEGYDSFASNVSCPASDASYSYAQKPGQYYLDMGPINASYSVTVEDYY